MDIYLKDITKEQFSSGYIDFLKTKKSFDNINHINNILEQCFLNKNFTLLYGESNPHYKDYIQYLIDNDKIIIMN